MKEEKKIDEKLAFLFFIIPAIFVISGIILFPYNAIEQTVDEIITSIPLFLGLILLGIGFYYGKKQNFSNKIKIVGWLLFAFFWSTQINSLYYEAEGDIVNAIICIAGIFVLSYLAYHEWLSLVRKEKISCLNWIAGAAAISGLIYFIMDMTPLAIWLRETVAAHSAWILKVFSEELVVKGLHIWYKQANIVIIFACTAVQSMVIFVGMILPLENVEVKRKIYGLIVTVVPVYFLNLVRNAMVIYLVGNNITDFNMAHNILGKGGSLIALVILLYIVISIIPEIFDEIVCLADLTKRKGPLEKFLKKV